MLAFGAVACAEQQSSAGPDETISMVRQVNTFTDFIVRSPSLLFLGLYSWLSALLMSMYCSPASEIPLKRESVYRFNNATRLPPQTAA